ncbi:DUF3185 family protein [Pseudomonas sp. gcc21]|uniref:DUF3185 family protein n=1 Tax=Pseudomonas sp. gcc21 TaxID=2726989 RepID=UPI001451AD6B|nr:DUF3185 family protein [Pseudomonas sp. gcc21]QJD58457.1 DUF3185 family protein [Pseudomonas sp. gcc21]
MATQKMIGIVLLALGLILLYFGWQSSQSLGDQVVETFTGRFTEGTMWYLIVGGMAIVAGAILVLLRKG